MTDTPTDTLTVTDTPTETYTPTDTSTYTSTDTPTRTHTPTVTSTDTLTYTPTLTSTPTESPTDTSTWTATYTYSPTDTPTETMTDTLTGTPTRTYTSTETPTETDTPTPTSTLTYTGTSTDTVTWTGTSTSTATPTVTLTPTIANTLAPTSTPFSVQVVRIYDNRGELVRQLVGSIASAPTLPLNLTVSAYVPDPSGAGGTVTIDLNGVALAQWDALDSQGRLVDNGVYHIVVEYRTSDGERAVLSQNVALSARSNVVVPALFVVPNPAAQGGTVRFKFATTGTVSGIIKIYTVSGELVRLTVLEGGSGVWDCRTPSGTVAAAGMYIAVYEGTDPGTRVPVHSLCRFLLLP